MKKLLAILLFFVIATSANAAVTITADDTMLPIYGTTTIGVDSDGTTPWGTLYMGLTTDSPGSLTPPGGPIQPCYEPGLADLLGVKDLLIIELPDFPPPPTFPPGTIADNIIFTCEGVGNANILLFDGEYSQLDSLIITQPEPATIALLGLGALLLRRKK